MTTPKARRRLPVGETYVVVSTGLAGLVALGIRPAMTLPALIVLMLPVSIVGFAVVVNVVFLYGDSLPGGWSWEVPFVAAVVVLAWLQVRLLRVIARNWRTYEPAAPPPA